MDDFQLADDSRREKPDIATVIDALQNGELINSQIFYGLSDLHPAEIDQLKAVWGTLEDEYRRKFMKNLAEVGEVNFEFDYSAIGKMALDDPDTEVRQAAIDVLFEDESIELMDRLIDIAQWDEALAVRAAALSALGRFILQGELGEFPENEAARAQDIAINILNNIDEEVEVRRRALEAISNSSHEIVEGAIKDAYESHEHKMRVSSIFAMGRSCDDQWVEEIMHELDSADPEMRYEAARAAGELMIPDSVPALTRMVFEDDRELQDTAIWSLGEIGGKEAIRVLTTLSASAQEAKDTDLIEAIDDALVNANLSGSDLYMFKMDDE